MKIVINKKYGGFGLSAKAETLLARHYGEAPYLENRRHDPVLVRMIEAHGADVIGARWSTLHIVTVENDYYLASIDGAESVDLNGNDWTASFYLRPESVNVRIMDKKDDMFASPAKYICDAVNCVGAHGAGLAAEFEKRFPLYSAGYKAAAKNGAVSFKSFPFRLTENGKTCLAIPTMTLPGSAANLGDIAQSLRSLRLFMDVREPEGVDIAIPALGCGIGGMEFNVLKHLVYAAFGDTACLHTVSLYPPR